MVPVVPTDGSQGLAWLAGMEMCSRTGGLLTSAAVLQYLCKQLVHAAPHPHARPASLSPPSDTHLLPPPAPRQIPSDNVVFNKAPAMKAREICEAAKAALRSGRYDMVRVNFANPDMVGHTGDLEATRVACELCDACVGELIEVSSAAGRQGGRADAACLQCCSTGVYPLAL